MVQGGVKMKLRELRIKNNLTQSEIAIKLGVSSQTILNWENGLFEPNIKNLISLADMFNVTIDYLVERKHPRITIDDLCNELEKISKEDFINFIKETLNK